MTATLPVDVQQVFDRFITTEMTTIAANGQPITWPLTPYYDLGAPTIDVTTGIGYPKKANDARANPKIAMLFSDPNGSRAENPPTVLVQGDAEVDDRDLRANAERYAREGAIKLPAANAKLPPKFTWRFAEWYFARIYIKLQPQRVWVWREGSATAPEVVLGETPTVDGGVSGEAASGVWDERIESLGSRMFPTAVISVVGADGYPVSVRAGARPDAAARVVVIDGDFPGVPLAPGAACLAAHAHNPEFTWQLNFQVRGDLVRADDGWVLVPRKLVGGFELPQGTLNIARANFQKVKRFRKTAKRELTAREDRAAA